MGEQLIAMTHKVLNNAWHPPGHCAKNTYIFTCAIYYRKLSMPCTYLIANTLPQDMDIHAVMQMALLY